METELDERGNERTHVSKGNELVTQASQSYALGTLQSLRRIMRGVDLYSRRLAEKYQVTVPQLICLVTLNQDGRLSPSQLGRKVYLNPSTITGIVDRLEAKGLVTRKRDGRDRRMVYITLSDAGKTLVEKAPPPLQERLTEGLSRLSDRKRAQIAKVLNYVVELMEIEHLDAAPILETGPIVPKSED